MLATNHVLTASNWLQLRAYEISNHNRSRSIRPKIVEKQPKNEEENSVEENKEECSVEENEEESSVEENEEESSVEEAS